MRIRLVGIFALTSVLLCTIMTARGQEPGDAILSVAAFDVQTDEPLYARILVNREQGRDGCRVDGQEPFRVGTSFCYIVPQRLTFQVPAGSVTVQLFRGLEYEPVSDEFEIAPGERAKKVYRLQRWIDMTERNHYSGDMHIHHPVQVVPDHVLAEDLNVGTCISSWVTETDTTQDTPAVDHLRKIDARHVYSINDQEIERFPIDKYDGPAYLVNLDRQIHLDSPGPLYPMNLEYQREARKAGGTVCLHSAGFQDAAVSVALGEVDAMGLACNFFGYAYSLTRVKRYGNADDLTLYGDTAWGTLNMTLGKYYRLLNCGFRLPASAGSAAGVKPNPVGHNRAYVQITEDFSYASYFDAFRAGKSFVTNGPMLLLSVNDLGPGEAIEYAENAETDLSVSVEARWNRPIGKVDLIVNGEVMMSFTPEGDRKSLQETFRWKPIHSGWLAARAFGERQLPIRFAHTSPVYIHIPTRPSDPSADAAYFAKWIGRRIEALGDETNFTAPGQRETVRRQLHEARAVFTALVRE